MVTIIIALILGFIIYLLSIYFRTTKEKQGDYLIEYNRTIWGDYALKVYYKEKLILFSHDSKLESLRALGKDTIVTHWRLHNLEKK